MRGIKKKSKHSDLVLELLQFIEILAPCGFNQCDHEVRRLEFDYTACVRLISVAIFT